MNATLTPAERLALASLDLSTHERETARAVIWTRPGTPGSSHRAFTAALLALLGHQATTETAQRAHDAARQLHPDTRAALTAAVQSVSRDISGEHDPRLASHCAALTAWFAALATILDTQEATTP